MAVLPKVVAVEADKEKMSLYFHENETNKCIQRPFSPWFIAAEALEGAQQLEGTLPLSYKIPGVKKNKIQ